MREISEATISLLNRLAKSDVVQPIDLAFARFLASLDGAQSETLALTGTLLSHARSRGHSCIALRSWAGLSFPGRAKIPLPVLPAYDVWIEALRSSGVAGGPEETLPLVLDDADRVYLYRYWHAEQRIARHLGARLQVDKDAVPWERAQTSLQALYDLEASEGIDWQAVAAVSVLRHRLSIICGGPGTGKTTTVARILAMLLSVNPGLNVVLATPTGKAAQRLGRAIARQVATLPVEEAVREHIPTEACTLHRLLGYHPQTDRYRYHAERPIDADVVVVDESSMADLLLFEALLEALPAHARIILLGDPDQLASVETGFVFGDLCRGGEAPLFSQGFAQRCAELSGIEVPVDKDAGPLHDSVVALQKNYRFDAASGIGALATAIRAGDNQAALDCLRSEVYGDVQLIDPSRLSELILQRMGSYARRLCQETCVEEALRLLEAVRLLSATRWGPRGVYGLNQLVEVWLLKEGLRRDTPWYHGRPILITANDYTVELFNGDVGVCWQEGGSVYSFFSDEMGGIRRVPLAKLPSHESAWAMTVHKSQGSEFEEVLLVLPETPIELLNRELLYTAVTRAKRSVTILGHPDIITYSVQHPEWRDSGLTAKLASLTRQGAL